MVELQTFNNHLTMLDLHDAIYVAEKTLALKVDRSGDIAYRVNGVDVSQPMKPVLISDSDQLEFANKKDRIAVSYELNDGTTVSVEKHSEMQRVLNCKIPVIKTNYTQVEYAPLKINVIGTGRTSPYPESWVDIAIEYGSYWKDSRGSGNPENFNFKVYTKRIIDDTLKTLSFDKDFPRHDPFNGHVYKGIALTEHLRNNTDFIFKFTKHIRFSFAVDVWYSSDEDQVKEFVEFVKQAVSGWIKYADDKMSATFTIDEIRKICVEHSQYFDNDDYDCFTDVLMRIAHQRETTNG